MSSTDNPYRPPSAVVADVRDPAAAQVFATPGATVDAGRGAGWIGEGWALFKAAPALWIVAMLILFGLQFALGLIPVLGNLAAVLLGPLFMAGVLAFGHGVARDGQADLGALFIGFREKTGALVMVGVLYFLLILGLIVVFAGAAFFLMGGAAVFAAGAPEQVMSAIMAGGGVMAILLLVLVFFAFGILVAAAYWFAPGLVLYTDLGAWPAMKESFSACMRNWLPFLVYGILAFVVLLGGMVILFVGMFLLSLPILMASYYASFRDIFAQKA